MRSSRSTPRARARHLEPEITINYAKTTEKSEKSDMTGFLIITPLIVVLCSACTAWKAWKDLNPVTQPPPQQPEDHQTRHQSSSQVLASNVVRVDCLSRVQLEDIQGIHPLARQIEVLNTRSVDQPPSYNTLFTKERLTGKTRQDSLPTFEEAMKM